VEGAVLTGERHILIGEVRDYFIKALGDHVRLNDVGSECGWSDPDEWVIDCTFCSNDTAGVDRFEACVVGLLEGPTDRAVTIMDGPFPSIYPWDEKAGLCSLSSAEFTPVRRCKTHAEAQAVLDELSVYEVGQQCTLMMQQMRDYWPDCMDLFRIADARMAVRAMPPSSADSRLLDLVKIGPRHYRVRAGKIDAVLHAERLVNEVLHVGGDRIQHDHH
jgi:hypothetical protein